MFIGSIYRGRGGRPTNGDKATLKKPRGRCSRAEGDRDHASALSYVDVGVDFDRCVQCRS